VGAWLFQHRLVVMASAFGVAILSAVQAAARHGGQPAWWDAPVLYAVPGWPQTALLVTGLGCLAAFTLRLLAEARLGSAVYGQGETPALVSSGPFRFTRNPLYGGTWLFFVSAVALWAPAVPWACLCALFFLALDRMAAHEESLLAASLGAPYRRYRDDVPRWLPRPGRAARGSGAPPPSGREWAAAALGNLGLLSLGGFRVAVALGAPAGPLGAVNLVLLATWLGVMGRRRWLMSRR
jgi:protein-S-isoprenylcysteine O-methyltransferase Ste14